MGIIVPIEMPKTCSECPFTSTYMELLVDANKGLYKKIAQCTLEPENTEDGYRSLKWLMQNKFSYCPLKNAD